MATPAISVAMSVYNGERFLAPAIESILGQSFGDFEFLILDDGSRDATQQIIASYAARDSRIRPIIRENRGLVASLNQLLHESRAPLIARMDADDISRADRLQKQHDFLHAHPDYGVVGSWTEDIDELGQPYHTPNRNHPVTHEDVLQAIAEDGIVLCHPVVTYRRDLVLAAGGYRPAFAHVEDHDLWLRLSGMTRLGNLPHRLIKYRHSAQQVSNRHATHQQIGHAVAWLAWRERHNGRPDPTAGLERLPPLGSFDALFGQPGFDAAIRARLASALQYSRWGLGDEGLDHIIRHVQDGGSQQGLWRTVLRLLRFRMPLRAARLALALAANRDQQGPAAATPAQSASKAPGMGQPAT